MKDLKKIKAALKTLQSIDGVEGCFLEAEVGDILHVYTITRRARYDLDKRIFQEYAECEKCFPQGSFELLITSQPPSLQAVWDTPRTSRTMHVPAPGHSCINVGGKV